MSQWIRLFKKQILPLHCIAFIFWACVKFYYNK
jgi:hypothetical protein